MVVMYDVDVLELDDGTWEGISFFSRGLAVGIRRTYIGLDHEGGGCWMTCFEIYVGFDLFGIDIF